MKSILTNSEKQIIVDCLNLRKNLIETGNPVLSRNDAIESGNKKIIKTLHPAQLDLVRTLESLMLRISNSIK